MKPSILLVIIVLGLIGGPNPLKSVPVSERLAAVPNSFRSLVDSTERVHARLRAATVTGELNLGAKGGVTFIGRVMPHENDTPYRCRLKLVDTERKGMRRVTTKTFASTSVTGKQEGKFTLEAAKAGGEHYLFVGFITMDEDGDAAAVEAKFFQIGSLAQGPK